MRTVSELIDPTTLGMGTHALDPGCAVGRSTFELASHCSKVKGIDFPRLLSKQPMSLSTKVAFVSLPGGRRLVQGSRPPFLRAKGSRLSSKSVMRAIYPPLGLFRHRACGQFALPLARSPSFSQSTARSGETRRTTFAQRLLLGWKNLLQRKIGLARVIRRKS